MSRICKEFFNKFYTGQFVSLTVGIPLSS